MTNLGFDQYVEPLKMFLQKYRDVIITLGFIWLWLVRRVFSLCCPFRIDPGEFCLYLGVLLQFTLDFGSIAMPCLVVILLYQDWETFFKVFLHQIKITTPPRPSLTKARMSLHPSGIYPCVLLSFDIYKLRNIKVCVQTF